MSLIYKIVLQKYSFANSGVHEKRLGFLNVFIDILMFCCVPWLSYERTRHQMEAPLERIIRNIFDIQPYL
jgi:hypothetical protein